MVYHSVVTYWEDGGPYCGIILGRWCTILWYLIGKMVFKKTSIQLVTIVWYYIGKMVYHIVVTFWEDGVPYCGNLLGRWWTIVWYHIGKMV